MEKNPNNLGLDDLQAQILVSTLLSMILPYITAVAVQKHWLKSTKVFVAGLLALLAAIFTAWVTGKLNALNVLTCFGIIVPASQSIFRNIAKHLGVDTLEEETTVGKEGDSDVVNTD